MTRKPWTKKKSRTRTFDLWTAIGIIGCLLLPFIHDLVTDDDGSLKGWVPDLGIRDLLREPDGGIWGYSSYRVFLALSGMQLFSFIGWCIALDLAKGKPFRFAILFPVAISGYQFLLVVFNLRQTSLNGWDYKFGIVMAIGVLLSLQFFLNKNNERTTGKH